MKLTKLSTTHTKVDTWLLQSVGNGIQIVKNGKNICFTTSFDKAWSWVTNQGTEGDNIEIKVTGTLS